MLAVIAASTKMHSRPSRNTRTPMSRKATVGLVFGCVGSGDPWAVTPCHTITAATQVAAAIMPMRNASFITVKPITSVLRPLPLGCFFLAANCADFREADHAWALTQLPGLHVRPVPDALQRFRAGYTEAR